MRVLYLTPYYKPAWFYGGPPKCIAEQAERLSGLGYALEVVTLNANGTEALFDSTEPVVQTVAGVRVHYLPAAPDARRKYFYAPALKAYLARFRHFDVVHIHTLFNHFSRAGMQWAHRHAKPYVVTPHGMLNRYALKRSAVAKQLHRLLFEDRLLTRADAVQFTTRIEHQTAALPRRLDNAVFVPNGVSFDHTKPVPSATDSTESRLRLIFLGRLNRVKGLGLLIDALALLSPPLRRRVALDLYGPDDDAYQATLAQQVSAHRLQAQVSFRGRLAAADRDATFGRYDALVLTSYLENFGLVVVEALHQELPVLVSDQVSLSDFVREHDCGWVSTLDPADIARKIEAVSRATPEERRARGRRGKAAAVNNFSLSTVARQLDQMYQDVYQKSRTS